MPTTKLTILPCVGSSAPVEVSVGTVVRFLRLLRPISVGVAAVVLAAGCSDSSGSTVQPAVKAATLSLFNEPVQLPWAQAKVTAACMAEHGFEYPPYAAFSSTAEPAAVSLSAFGAPLTLQEAQRHGYGDRIPRDGDGSAQLATDAVQDYLRTLPPEKRKEYWQAAEPDGSEFVSYELADGAVASVAKEGCVAEGRKAIYGSVANALRITQFSNEMLSFSTEAVESAKVKDALAVYAGCMDAEGYDVATPGQARTEAFKRFAGDDGVAPASVTLEERSMAVADAVCQKRSDINAVLDEQILIAASEFLNENEGQILGYGDLQQNALERAQHVLAS